jgi:hypothetical protein
MPRGGRERRSRVRTAIERLCAFGREIRVASQPRPQTAALAKLVARLADRGQEQNAECLALRRAHGTIVFAVGLGEPQARSEDALDVVSSAGGDDINAVFALDNVDVVAEQGDPVFVKQRPIRWRELDPDLETVDGIDANGDVVLVEGVRAPTDTESVLKALQHRSLTCVVRADEDRLTLERNRHVAQCAEVPIVRRDDSQHLPSPSIS